MILQTTKNFVPVLFCLIFLVSGIAFAQDSEDQNEIERQKRNLVADTGYALLNINTSNVFLNLGARLGNAAFMQADFQSIGENLFAQKWVWEDGDRFLINQFGHPYQGSTYFTSARANGFNFYESILFGPVGSFLWETTCERGPSINDLITTPIGGAALGEMFHRLFLEVDASSSLAAKIGGFFVSPIDSFNRVYNRPVRETGGGKIYDFSVKAGLEKTSAFFQGHQNEADSWKYPGTRLEINVVYGNPFEQQSKTPYEHFELNAGITTNVSSYDMEIISDGYLFSFLFGQAASFTSTGLTMHYDFFNATNDILDNTGYGNIQFSASSIAWTIKHKRSLSEKSYVEAKAHLGFTFWGNSMYNGDIFTDNYLGNTYSTYGVGESAKFFFTAAHQKWGTLEFAALGYHLDSIAVNESHSDGHVFFVNASMSYEFPLTARINIGIKQDFSGLFGMYDSAEDISRMITPTGIYIRIR